MQNGSVTLGKGLALRAEPVKLGSRSRNGTAPGLGEACPRKKAVRPSPDQRRDLPVECHSCAFSVGFVPEVLASAGRKQPTQNWQGPGESDCLIKTKRCEGR
ncbi:hypothetical protein MRX96_020684 [Rhipicephalus microplus]